MDYTNKFCRLPKKTEKSGKGSGWSPNRVSILSPNPIQDEKPQMSKKETQEPGLKDWV